MSNLTQLTDEQGGGLWDDVPTDSVFEVVSKTRSTGRFNKKTLATELMALMFPANGVYTWLGSGATAAVTVAGALTTDRVIATIKVKPTQAASLARAVVSAANTVTFELSAANTSNDAQISYLLVRTPA